MAETKTASNLSTSVNVRNVDPEVRATAEAAALELGFRSLTGWVRRRVYELAETQRGNDA